MKDWNLQPFAGDFLIGKHLELYRDALHISWCIETGTQLGSTTRYLANLFKRVITIEVSENYHREATEFLNTCGNVVLVLGESDRELEKILSLDEPDVSILFFLDAHGFGHDCPLNRELAVIAKHRQNNRDVIVIHDFLVPDRPELGFDSYQDGPIDFQSVVKGMDAIWPNGWTVRYNDVASGGMRGCAFFTGRA